MSIFLTVLFNMEWLLPSATPQQRKECLSFLRFWLSSIAVNATDVRNAGHNFPPVFLVGTHKDRVSSPGQHEDISVILYDTFSGLPVWPAVEPFAEAEVTRCLRTTDFALYTSLQCVHMRTHPPHSHSTQNPPHGQVSTGRGLLFFFPVDNTKGRADPVFHLIMQQVQLTSIPADLLANLLSHTHTTPTTLFELCIAAPPLLCRWRPRRARSSICRR